jgi:hypothetical protein
VRPHSNSAPGRQGPKVEIAARRPRCQAQSNVP